MGDLNTDSVTTDGMLLLSFLSEPKWVVEMARGHGTV